jgi:hypothetical protein
MARLPGIGLKRNGPRLPRGDGMDSTCSPFAATLHPFSVPTGYGAPLSARRLRSGTRPHQSTVFSAMPCHPHNRVTGLRLLT